MAITSVYFFDKIDNIFKDLNVHEKSAIEWTVVHAQGIKSFNGGKKLDSDENVIESMREVEKVYLDNYNALSKFKNDSDILQSHLQKTLGLRDDVLMPNYDFELDDDMITSYAKEYANENCLVLNDDIEPTFHFMVRNELARVKFETLKDAVYYTLKKLERGYTQKDIIKLACKELNISESELSEELNVNTYELNKWKEKGYPEFLEKVLDLLIENKKLKESI